jgi:hypothetical protein
MMDLCLCKCFRSQNVIVCRSAFGAVGLQIKNGVSLILISSWCTIIDISLSLLFVVAHKLCFVRLKREGNLNKFDYDGDKQMRAEAK